MKPSSRGFTLIELMVVIAVTAILLAVAAPSFSRFMDSQRLRTVSTAFHSSLVKARSEAIKRNANVLVVPNDTDFKKGWRICLEANCTTVLSVESGANSSYTFNPSGTATTFTPNGRSTASTSYSVKSTQYTDAEMCVVVSTSGTPQLKKGAC